MFKGSFPIWERATNVLGSGWIITSNWPLQPELESDGSTNSAKLADCRRTGLLLTGIGGIVTFRHCRTIRGFKSPSKTSPRRLFAAGALRTTGRSLARSEVLNAANAGCSDRWARRTSPNSPGRSRGRLTPSCEPSGIGSGAGSGRRGYRFYILERREAIATGGDYRLGRCRCSEVQLGEGLLGRCLTISLLCES
jgi:hypothetical protein